MEGQVRTPKLSLEGGGLLRTPKLSLADAEGRGGTPSSDIVITFALFIILRLPLAKIQGLCVSMRRSHSGGTHTTGSSVQGSGHHVPSAGVAADDVANAFPNVLSWTLFLLVSAS